MLINQYYLQVFLPATDSMCLFLSKHFKHSMQRLIGSAGEQLRGRVKGSAARGRRGEGGSARGWGEREEQEEEEEEMRKGGKGGGRAEGKETEEGKDTGKEPPPGFFLMGWGAAGAQLKWPFTQ